MQVLVRDNNVDQALRVLKKRLQQEGVFREMRLREHFEKPSEKRAREKAEGIRRTRKLARKKLSRELGIAPVRKPKTVSDAKSFLGIPVVFDASLNTVSTPAFQGLAARWLTSDATAD